jgi:hypothetical protein
VGETRRNLGEVAEEEAIVGGDRCKDLLDSIYTPSEEGKKLGYINNPPCTLWHGSEN